MLRGTGRDHGYAGVRRASEHFTFTLADRPAAKHANTRMQSPPWDRNPPPLVQAAANDHSVTEPTPGVAWTRPLLHASHGAQTMRKDVLYPSESREANHGTKAPMPRSTSSTQNMHIIHLKAQASHSTHGTQQDQWKTAPPKSTVRKSTSPKTEKSPKHLLLML